MPRWLERVLTPHTEHAYALLRIVAGALLSFHGMQKILGLLTTNARPQPLSQMWFGGIIELTCGIAVALGILTRPAAFLASGTMAVAYFQFHWKLDLGTRIFPIVNKGELAVVFSFLFLYVACKGPGSWSLAGRRYR
jgi:putative oxidoreductase